MHNLSKQAHPPRALDPGLDARCVLRRDAEPEQPRRVHLPVPPVKRLRRREFGHADAVVVADAVAPSDLGAFRRQRTQLEPEAGGEQSRIPPQPGDDLVPFASLMRTQCG